MKDPNVKPQNSEMSDADLAAVTAWRAKRKIPVFEAMEEINLVPYLDIVTNLILFLMISVMYILPLGVISIVPPVNKNDGGAAAQQDQKKEEKNLLLILSVTRDGFIFIGNLEITGEREVPKKNGQYDFEKLAQVAANIKTQYPDNRTVFLTAEPDIRYEMLINVMDNVRNKADGSAELFDNVQLSTGVYLDY